MKFKLHDIRESKVWKEAYEEGIERGKTAFRQDVVRRLLATGMTREQIAELIGISAEEVQRLAGSHSHGKRGLR